MFLFSEILMFYFHFYFIFFFFNDTATTEIYTLSLHDALPTCLSPRSLEGDTRSGRPLPCAAENVQQAAEGPAGRRDQRQLGRGLQRHPFEPEVLLAVVVAGLATPLGRQVEGVRPLAVVEAAE